jgi:glycosyltransferase involved in cell wall biosynthesis
MITGRDIVFISSIEWNFLWQGHQEIARRLAAAGNRVLYLENTGVRSPGVRDAARVAFRLKRWTAALRTGGLREVAPNVHVCSPLVLPPFGPRWRRQLNRRLFIPLVLRTARRLGFTDPLVWTYLPNDTTLDLIRLLPRSGVVYYCVADFAQLTPHPAKLRAAERELIERSDVVFTQCSALARMCLASNPNVHVFPSGVNLEAFPFEGGEAAEGVEGLGRAATAAGGVPSDGKASAGKVTAGADEDSGGAGAGDGSWAIDEADARLLRDLPRPVVGYVGGMHRHVDFDLLKQMAAARPEWSWVCVGALQADPTGLGSLPNVHLLGQKPHERLAGYIRRFDVCVVPYVNNAYTATVVPTKINEYLAMGKPVVSTDLPTVLEFNERHRVLVTAPPRAESFLLAVERALRLPKDRATRLRRRRVAETCDWGAQLEAMSDLVEEGIDAKSGDARRARAATSRR